MSANGRISDRVRLFDTTITIEKLAFGPLAVKETYKKRIQWDPTKFKLMSARITVAAEQTVTSGAELDILWNGEPLDDLNWHALETREESVSAGVSVLNGDNSLELVYKVTAAHPLAAELYVTEAAVQLTYQEVKVRDTRSTFTGGRVTSSGTAKDNEATTKQLNKFADKVINNLLSVVIVVVIVSVSLLILDKVVFSRIGGLVGMFRKVSNKFRNNNTYGNN